MRGFQRVEADDVRVEALGIPVFTSGSVPDVPDARLRLAGIAEESVVDGPGIRLAVFAQGCPHQCPGCHNPSTHAFSGGTEYAVTELLSRLTRNPMVAGITLTGGEPFSQAEACYALAKGARAMGYSVVTYTGYTFSELAEMARNHEGIQGLISCTDLLIDGRYEESRRNLSLPYRGSSNQQLWVQ